MIINMTGGGGGAGATLVVTGVTGSTCTVSKDTKTYTKTFGADSTATFKGLTTGTWTVTMTNSTQTAVRTIVITSDYTLTIAYFSATINITYPANSTCVVADSSGTTVTTNTSTTDSTKTFVATVSATGTYTITATSADGTKTKSTSVTITTKGQAESVTLTYELVLFDNGIINDIKWDANNRSGAAGDSTSSVSNKISLTAHGYWDGNYYSSDAVRGTSDSFDLSTYSTLKIQVSAVSSFATRQVWIGTTSLKGNVATMNVSSTGTVSCDISAINSQCFISFYVSTRGQSSNGNASLNVTKVWLE